MSLSFGNRDIKLYTLEDGNMVSKFIKRGTNKEDVWEHRAILGGNKDAPPGDPPNGIEYR